MESARSISKYPGHYKKKLSPSEYAENKIRLLTKEMGIQLTREEKEQFYLLGSDEEIDRYAHSIIDEKL